MATNFKYQRMAITIMEKVSLNVRLTDRNQSPAFRLSSSFQVNLAAGVLVRFGKTSWMLVVRCKV